MRGLTAPGQKALEIGHSPHYLKEKAFAICQHDSQLMPGGTAPWRPAMFTYVQRRTSSQTRSGPAADRTSVTTTPQRAGEASPRLVAQARLAGLAASSSHSAQLRALQAHADARSLPAGVAAVQRVGADEEELLQGRFAAAVQRVEGEEEDPLQARFAAAPVQRLDGGEEKPAQRAEKPAAPDRSGLPGPLKAGIESLSGLSMDHVRVHYNSSQPAQLNALAYAQGSDIHLAPGQERHLPHEAWHVVQQAQGRVRPTMQMKGGVAVNDDAGLEREADEMGGRAVQTGSENKVRDATAEQTDGVVQGAWVGRRKLEPIPSIFSKPDDKDHAYRLGPFHEHIFFEDRGQPPNLGFGPKGLFVEKFENLLTQYENHNDGYGDKLMRMAVGVNNDPGPYSVVSNNCQSWVASVLDTYRLFDNGSPHGDRTGLLTSQKNTEAHWPPRKNLIV